MTHKLNPPTQNINISDLELHGSPQKKQYVEAAAEAKEVSSTPLTDAITADIPVPKVIPTEEIPPETFII